MNVLSETVEKGIARNVRKARETQGLKKTDVAEALGLTKQGYTPYERHGRFTCAQLLELSRLFDRPIEWFLGLPSELTEDEQQLLAAYREINNPTLEYMAQEMVRAQVTAAKRLREERE